MWGGALGATVLIALAIVLLFSFSGGEPGATGDLRVPETALVHVIERDITTLREELKNPFYGILRRFEWTADTAHPGKANPFLP